MNYGFIQEKQHAINQANGKRTSQTAKKNITAKKHYSS